MAAQGTGTVRSLFAPAPADIQNALLMAFRTTSSPSQSLTASRRVMVWSGYEVPDASPSEYFTLESTQSGCNSAAEVVANLAPALALDTSRARGPALNGSISLPAFNGSKTLNGTLHIQFDDNGGMADVVQPSVVPVRFPNGSYTASQVAAVIHHELSLRESGRAAAYPDGIVVIETGTPGLAGSVRVPAPGTATGGDDQAVKNALLGSVPELFGRGWPGIGMPATANGFRSKSGAARHDADWEFENAAGVRTSPAIHIAAGQTLTDIARAVHGALNVGGTRIGICLVSEDTLWIEGMPGSELNFAGRSVLAVTRPGDDPGVTADLAEEPACGLLRTRIPRTVRYSRDRIGNGVRTDFDDAGWVLLPRDENTARLITSARGGTPLVFPSGRYRLAIRAEAAKTHGYAASGDMIASAGTAGGQSFVHRARYWVGVGRSSNALLGITAAGDNDFLAEFLIWL
jgi:hypothetical protein